ncbi:hypothetical protein WJX74_006135 [Apatococcus lobatus]|uniref:Uridine kinase n=2 Tax=Apatococcus TaxID=904362 RepID=A0AAW1SMI6_9CHLO
MAQHTRTTIIGVAGGTASGKTSVCTSIMAQLRLEFPDHTGFVNISQDSFYRDLTEEEHINIAEFNFDHPDAFSFEEIVNTVKALKAGRQVDIPVYDFVTSARTTQTIPIAKADVVLMDGILIFYHPELRDLFDMKIFVDTDADIRLARRMRRDIVDRGRSVLSVLNQYEKFVKPSFDSYILPTKQHADIIIPRGAENAVAIDLIHQHIKWNLMQQPLLHSSRRSL